MRNGYKVLDTDAHQMEPASIWADYIDEKFKDRAPCQGDLVFLIYTQVDQ